MHIHKVRKRNSTYSMNLSNFLALRMRHDDMWTNSLDTENFFSTSCAGIFGSARHKKRKNERRYFTRGNSFERSLTRRSLPSSRIKGGRSSCTIEQSIFYFFVIQTSTVCDAEISFAFYQLFGFFTSFVYSLMNLITLDDIMYWAIVNLFLQLQHIKVMARNNFTFNYFNFHRVSTNKQ